MEQHVDSHFVGHDYEQGNSSTTTRKISSVILESTPMSEIPGDTERYVEVPSYEEQVTYVTCKEVREIERTVPVVQYEYVDVIHEVPRVIYNDIDRVVERVQEVENIVMVKEYRDRNVDRVVEVKIPTKRYIQQRREVPGEIIERPVFVKKEHRVNVPRGIDHDVAVIVAQTVKPVITESNKHIDVAVFNYEPEVIPVDVHVAKPVTSSLEVLGMTEATHKLVNIHAAQYNTILRLLNSHLEDNVRETLPYVSEHGHVPFVPDADAQYIVAPTGIEIDGYQIVNSHPAIGSRMIINSRGEGESEIITTGVQQELGPKKQMGFCNFNRQPRTAKQAPVSAYSTHSTHKSSSHGGSNHAQSQAHGHAVAPSRDSQKIQTERSARNEQSYHASTSQHVIQPSLASYTIQKPPPPGRQRVCC